MLPGPMGVLEDEAMTSLFTGRCSGSGGPPVTSARVIFIHKQGEH